MAKYIDAETLKEGMSELLKSPWANDKSLAPRNLTIKEVLGTVKDLCIDDTPAADVEPVRKWIPCSERLPEMDEDVLTCDESGFITISSCNGGGEFSSYADDYYIGHRDKKPKVIAWQSLPEPPKMDGGSEE